MVQYTCMEKYELRRSILRQRRQLATKERNTKNQLISQKLNNLPLLKKAQKILVYLSMEDEVDTHEFIKKNLKEKTILTPRMNGNDLEIVELKNWKELKIHPKFNLLEIFNKQASSLEPDIILVPGVGFDPQGNRLGYGKGYYDRLLERFPQATTLALAYDLQIIEKIPTEDHDQMVQHILTETHHYTPNPFPHV